MPQLSDSSHGWARSWASVGILNQRPSDDPGSLFHLQDPTGSLGLTNCKYSSFNWCRENVPEFADGLDPISIILVTFGEVRIEAGREARQYRAGDGLVIDFARSCTISNDSLTTTEKCILFLPRARVLAPSSALERGLPFSGATLAGGLLASTLSLLSGRLGSTSPVDLTNLAPAMTSLVSAVMQEAMDPAIKWGREQRISRIIRFIDANLASQALEPDMIAGHFAMSRATLYRMFEPLGGVAGFIRERRLSRAMADLTAAGSPTRSIAAAGRKAGYPDAASFSRAFKARFGIPPAEAARIRRPSTRPEVMAKAPAAPSRARTLADLLREMSTRKR